MRKFTMLASIGVQPGEEGDINISGNNSTWDKTERRGDKRNNDVVPKVRINSHMLNQGVWSQSIKCYQLAVQLVLRSLNPFVILKITRFLQKFIMFLLFRPYALYIYDPITPHALLHCLRS